MIATSCAGNAARANNGSDTLLNSATSRNPRLNDHKAPPSSLWVNVIAGFIWDLSLAVHHEAASSCGAAYWIPV